LFKKLFHSAVFNSWFSGIVSLISSLIALPIVITKLSVEEINVWLLFSSIVVLSQGVQFGFNSTFSRFIVYVYNGVRIDEFKNLRFKSEMKTKSCFDENEFLRVFNLMRFIYLFVTILYFVLLCLVGITILSKPLNSLVNPIDGWIAGSIIAISTTLNLYFSYHQNFMLGINKVALLQRITGVINFFGIGIILLVFYFNPTLISLVFIYQVITLIVLFSIIYYSKKEFSNICFKDPYFKFDKELFHIVWHYAWKSGITILVSNLIRHMSVLIVSQFFSPAISASFLFTRKVFNIIENFTMITFQARLPVIAKYRGIADFDKLIPFLKQTQYITYGVFLLGYIILITGGEYILSFLNSNVRLGSHALIILFSFSTFMTRWGGMTLAISNQSNNVVEHINAVVVITVYSLIVFLGFVSLGVEVFPFALTLSMFAVAPFIIKYTYKYLFTTFWTYEKNVCIPYFASLTLINIIYLYYLKHTDSFTFF